MRMKGQCMKVGTKFIECLPVIPEDKQWTKRRLEVQSKPKLCDK